MRTIYEKKTTAAENWAFSQGEWNKSIRTKADTIQKTDSSWFLWGCCGALWLPCAGWERTCWHEEISGLRDSLAHCLPGPLGWGHLLASQPSGSSDWCYDGEVLLATPGLQYCKWLTVMLALATWSCTGYVSVIHEKWTCNLLEIAAKMPGWCMRYSCKGKRLVCYCFFWVLC